MHHFLSWLYLSLVLYYLIKVSRRLSSSSLTGISSPSLYFVASYFSRTLQYLIASMDQFSLAPHSKTHLPEGLNIVHLQNEKSRNYIPTYQINVQSALLKVVRSWAFYEHSTFWLAQQDIAASIDEISRWSSLISAAGRHALRRGKHAVWKTSQLPVCLNSHISHSFVLP